MCVYERKRKSKEVPQTDIQHVSKQTPCIKRIIRIHLSHGANISHMIRFNSNRSMNETNEKKNHLIRAIVWEMKFRLRLSHMMSNNGPKMDDWIPKFCKNNLKTLQFLNTINKRLHSSSSFLNFVWQRMWFNSFNTKRRWQINICYSSLTFVTGTKWKDRTTKNDYDISGCSLSQFLLLITILVPLTDMWCCIVVSIFSQVGRKRRSHDKTEISNKHKCCENKWL